MDLFLRVCVARQCWLSAAISRFPPVAHPRTAIGNDPFMQKKLLAPMIVRGWLRLVT